ARERRRRAADRRPGPDDGRLGVPRARPRRGMAPVDGASGRDGGLGRPPGRLSRAVPLVAGLRAPPDARDPRRRDAPDGARPQAPDGVCRDEPPLRPRRRRRAWSRGVLPARRGPRADPVPRPPAVRGGAARPEVVLLMVSAAPAAFLPN